MIINTEYKIIYLSNCKCASSTIRKHFLPIRDEELFKKIKKHCEGPHGSYDQVLEVLKTENINTEGFFLFSTIRNPWERIVSLYNYAKPDKNGVPSWGLNFGEKRAEGTSCTFKEFVFSRHNQKYKTNGDIGSLKYACRNVQDMFGEDYSKFKLYKSEELNVNKIMDDINNPSLEEKVGRTEFKIIDSVNWEIEKENRCSLNYREYYDDELQEVITNHYKVDIEIGEYEF